VREFWNSPCRTLQKHLSMCALAALRSIWSGPRVSCAVVVDLAGAQPGEAEEAGGEVANAAPGWGHCRQDRSPDSVKSQRGPGRKRKSEPLIPDGLSSLWSQTVNQDSDDECLSSQPGLPHEKTHV